MAETSIEWTSGPKAEPGYTFNPVRGCFKISPECKNCYAEDRDRRYEGGKHWGPAPHTPRIVRAEAGWREPVLWNREAEEAGQRRKVFCASLADVMEDHPTWVEPRKRLWRLILDTPNLDWLLLTKRPENFARFLPWADGGAPWPNVWGGVTGGVQVEFDRRVAILARTRFVVRFVSVEPQLEYIDAAPAAQSIDWIICGGESGNNARPFDIEWARSLRDQCKKLGVAFFMKQFGRRTRMRPAEVGGDADLPPMVFPMRKKESSSTGTRPTDLWVRQWPEVRHA